jgi:hypothetical protein
MNHVISHHSAAWPRPVRFEQGYGGARTLHDEINQSRKCLMRTSFATISSVALLGLLIVEASAAGRAYGPTRWLHP